MCETPCVLLSVMVHSHLRSPTYFVLIPFYVKGISLLLSCCIMYLFTGQSPPSPWVTSPWGTFAAASPILCATAATQLHGTDVTMVSTVIDQLQFANVQQMSPLVP